MSTIRQISHQVEAYLGGAWQSLGGVVSVTSDVEVTSERDAPHTFTAANPPTANLELALSVLSAIPLHLPVRVTYAVDGVAARAFVGEVVRSSGSSGSGTWSLQCEGMLRLLRRIKAYSRLFPVGTPIATGTTSTSIEDPAQPNYRAGPINWLFWQAGGRPSAQAASYPDALFYYRCDTAPLGPDYTWFHGEVALDELERLIRVAGGQIYQDQAGVLCYRAPHVYAVNTPTHTLADTGPITATRTVYTNLRVDTDHDKATNRVICRYTARREVALQTVQDDSTVRTIPAGEQIQFPLEFAHPVTALQLATPTTLPVSAYLISYPTGAPAAEGAWTQSISWTAQRIVITLTNTTSRLLQLSKVTIQGTPVIPAYTGSVSLGTGPEAEALAMEDSPYVQSEAHARRICLLYLQVQGALRPVYQISGCPWSSTLAIGDVVWLECAAMNLLATRCRIVAINDPDTGATADYLLVDLSGIPQADEYYLVGQTNYAGQSKRLGW